MAEFVVARAAEGGASGVVVVGLAGDAHAVSERGRGAGVAQRVPLRARLHYARPPRLLDQAGLLCAHATFGSVLRYHVFKLFCSQEKRYHNSLTWVRVVVVIVSLKNECERPLRTKWSFRISTNPSQNKLNGRVKSGRTDRPTERERQRERVERLGEREGVGAEDGRGGAAEGAGAGRGRRLVLFEAQREARAAGLTAGGGGAGRRAPSPGAARARRQLQPVVAELEDLQLEHARPRRALRQNGLKLAQYF